MRLYTISQKRLNISTLPLLS
uniref:Uncharacterized protein n=1 Tax=Rhizophora mucronata TaxID=61149 RepID=A0A2P2J082_RHIMU